MDDGKLLVAVGAAIRRHREGRGISQEGFADSIGMHRAYYGSVERGRRNLTLMTLVRLCEGLDVRPSSLLSEAEAAARTSRRR
ncbi:helix-turn-helix domain-containing protein [Novilysobacter selenitireducens]|uniref:Helix-turn-helix domain-containing protein n=1 Tax=Novilysobacter selenitireducens TaxID=2872639 RepID=A0ABS7T2H3_9GAMM|nr:helix-turn-helix transcriptional regulator [Lysobacter selenitireducens]MBZ4038076.1 helix-turn-helix domain-containing protein [Lysobacter selenitireducens]